jgi:hypothetical protein
LFSRDRRPTEANRQQEEPVDEVKPFDIPKREVWEAFKKVKANQGAAGVDGQSIAVNSCPEVSSCARPPGPYARRGPVSLYENFHDTNALPEQDTLLRMQSPDSVVV